MSLSPFKNQLKKLRVVLAASLVFFLQLSTVKAENQVPDRIELLTVASSTQAVASLFGHSALLLIPAGKTWRNGIVININANTNGRSQQELDYYTDAALGNYPFVIETFSAKTYFYKKLVEEGRDIERTPIPMTFEQKKNIWNKILDLEKNPEELGSYYFHYKNCSSMILYLLKQAGLQFNYEQVMARSKTGGVSPKQIPQLLRDALLTPFPAIKVLSIQSKILDLEKKYGISIGSHYSNKIAAFTPWSSKQTEKIKTMSVEELALAAQSLNFLDAIRSQIIQGEIKSRNQFSQTLFMEYKEIPPAFYSVCETSDCLVKLSQQIRSYYSNRDYRNLIASNFYTLQRTEQLFIPEVNLETSPQARQWRTLFHLKALQN